MEIAVVGTGNVAKKDYLPRLARHGDVTVTCFSRRPENAREVASYLSSVREGAPPRVPGIAGLEELRFEAALRRSISARRPVMLADEFPVEL